MKLAHIADSHLGIRQYHRQTPTGINQREADVANAFRGVIDDVIAQRADVVVIAGDLFHSVRPTNAAIVFAFRQFQRLREALPKAPVIVVAGNHDTPRSSETGSILKLFEELGLSVAADVARRFEFPELDLSVLAVPHQALVDPEELQIRPDGPARHQVLVIHAEVQGLLPADRPSLEYGGVVVTPDQVGSGAWSYIAWGHYHVRHQVGPKGWYPGSLEYTSNNIWAERAEEEANGIPGKGWLMVDVASGMVTPHLVKHARQVVDLPPIYADGLDASQLDAAIADRVASVPGGLAQQIVRLVVHDVPRPVAREVDHARIRAWKASALHFHLDMRRPVRLRLTGSGAPGRRQTLPEVVHDWLEHRVLPSEIDRERFVARGVELIEQVDSDGDGP
ncbi:MAG: Calcineurin-like phosphoesterase superfamily domain protein [Gemmatimonadetes bacterium]|nr:Calcineurin-like phosphoesterase superfamily domain protein [Gemmatimonadota bacterium]